MRKPTIKIKILNIAAKIKILNIAANPQNKPNQPPLEQGRI